MSDKKRAKQNMSGDDENKVTKEEYAVAKYLRFGLPSREGKLHGMEVKCFIGNAAVDKLLESKWSSANNKTDALFTNRASCVHYMNILLDKGLFHRADRDKKKKDKESTKKRKKEKEPEKDEPTGDEDLKQRKGKKDKKSKKDKEAVEKSKEETTDAKDEKKKEEKKKKEKRLKLLMSDHQWFEDADEVYVWIYDPVNVKTFLIGLLMVLGAIGLCMFPLWPEEVRIGVYYLSLAAAGFVGFILFLAVVRLILFCIVWAITFGRHHFWFLPNLTEDVGFFDSFRPLYKHDVVTNDESNSSNQKKKKKKKGNQEEKSEAKDQPEKSSDKDDSDEFEVIKKEDLDENKEGEDDNLDNSAEDEDEEDNENDDNSEEIDDDEAQNNTGSEREDKKSK